MKQNIDPRHAYTHCKNKIVKITNLLVSIVARNNANYNLIGYTGCYDCMIKDICVPIIIKYHV